MNCRIERKKIKRSAENKGDHEGLGTGRRTGMNGSRRLRERNRITPRWDSSEVRDRWHLSQVLSRLDSTKTVFFDGKFRPPRNGLIYKGYWECNKKLFSSSLLNCFNWFHCQLRLGLYAGGYYQCWCSVLLSTKDVRKTLFIWLLVSSNGICNMQMNQTRSFSRLLSSPSLSSEI